jgi:hypothetical protein
MTDIAREQLEREIAASEAAVKAHDEGAAIQRLVLKCFQDALKAFPDDEDDESNIPAEA